MPKLLAFDTATEACSAALMLEDKITSIFEIAPRQQSQRILVLIQQLLAQAQIKLNDLDAIAVSAGPGSFTGIRLAISVAQGLAFGAGLPLIAVSTLRVMAQGAYRDYHADQVLVAEDAHSGDVYWGIYQLDHTKTMQAAAPDQRCKPPDVTFPAPGAWLGVGSGWGRYDSLINQSDRLIACYARYYPNSEDLVQLAQVDLQRSLLIAPEAIMPHYLHQEDGWRKSTPENASGS